MKTSSRQDPKQKKQARKPSSPRNQGKAGGADLQSQPPMFPVRTKPFPAYNPIGREEIAAATRVMKTGLLSDFLGRHSEKFLGGRHVRELEQRWADMHQVKHAVSFNSATSALIAGIGALGLLPGDEVIVSPYSMCISATAPLFYDAVPVFADIEEDCFCLDPDDIETRITLRTRAILTVDLFGQSSDMDRTNRIARRKGLKVLCDASHVPGCGYKNGFAGTFGDMGVYSHNQHKIIHCGEGGIAVTNDDELALRLQLLRNHGEAVVGEMQYRNLLNLVGGNFRLPEIEAAIAIEQLKKLPKLIAQRRQLAEHLTEKLAKLDFLLPPQIRKQSEHVFYLFPIRFFADRAGLSRERYVQNVRDLGIPLYRLAEGYIKPLYLEPIFAHKKEFKKGFPYSLGKGARQAYKPGLCPVTERLYESEMIATAYTYPPLTRRDMDDIARAFTLAQTRK